MGEYGNAAIFAKNARVVVVQKKKEQKVKINSEQKITNVKAAKYKKAKDSIESSKVTIEKAKEFCTFSDLTKATELLDSANSAFNMGNYEEALVHAKKAEEGAVRVKRDYEVYKETADIISSIEVEIAQIKNAGVKIPKSHELLEPAKAELTKHNFVRAKKLSEDALKIASEYKAAYSRASDSISDVEKKLTNLQNKGVMIPSKLLTKSRQAFNTGSYDESIQLTDLITISETRYRNAEEELKSAESALQKAQEFGCTVSDIEEKLRAPHQLFAKGAYEESINALKRVEESVNRIIEEAKPVIVLEFPETAFKTNVWKPLNLILRNTGNAHAKGVTITFSQEVEVKKLEEVDLNVGEEKSLKIGFRPIQEGEIPLDTIINYRDFDNKEYADETTFWITVETGVGTGVDGGVEAQKPVIKRETEFFNGFIRMRMSVTNPMRQIISDVSLDLDYDENTLRLDRHEPEHPVRKEKVQLGSISPGTGKTVTFYLEPMTCTKAGTEINCRIDYKDAFGKANSLRMESKKVRVICPIFRTDSDINIGMLKEFINDLPCQDRRIYKIPNGMELKEVLELCRETIQMHDVRQIRTLYTPDGKTCESWYYGKTKVDKNNIVINGRINQETKSIELSAATPMPESLTGLLAELSHDLTKKIKAAGKKPEQVINVTMRENVIIRSPNLLNFCDMDGVCNEKNVVIEDNVIQRSEFGELISDTKGTGVSNVKIKGNVIQRTKFWSSRKCPNCGTDVKASDKFCRKCGRKLV